MCFGWNFFNENNSLQEAASDNRASHEHNVTPINSSESQNDKTTQHSDEDGSNTDKSPDDLEVDEILSHSKMDQQNTENCANLMVSSVQCYLSLVFSYCAKAFEAIFFSKSWIKRIQNVFCVDYPFDAWSVLVAAIKKCILLHFIYH